MSSSTTNLCDLPPELVGLIAERTDIISRCFIRKCSKDIRQIVDNSKHVCNKIEVYVQPTLQSIHIRIAGIPGCEYARKGNNCVIRRIFLGRRRYICETTLNGEDNLEVAINDLMTILKNPKLIIKDFVIHENPEREEGTVSLFTAALYRKLSGLNHKLHVESIELVLEEEDMLQMLSFCQPKILRILRFPRFGQKQLTRITTMEHWKQAEILYSEGNQPLEEIFHFKQVSMRKYVNNRVCPSWEEFKTFMEIVVAQAEHSPKKFIGTGFFFKQELEEYTRNMVKVPGDEYDKTVLKTLMDGSQIVLLFSDCWVLIDKYVDGESVFEDQFEEMPVF